MNRFRKIIVFLSFLFFSVNVFAQGIEVRFSNLPLSPEQKPNFDAFLKNTGKEPFEGTLKVSGPDGWTFLADSAEVSLAPSGNKRLVFTLAQGRPNTENRYLLAYELKGKTGAPLKGTQEIRTTTAPNSKLEVAGPTPQGTFSPKWEDAIAIRWSDRGKETEMRTVWSRKRLSILIGVQGLEAGTADQPAGIQIAVGAVKSNRSPGLLRQFLLFSAGEDAKIVELTPDSTTSPKNLAEVPGSKSFRWTQGETTWFETSLDFKSIPEIKPGEGRELTFSFLIHDPKNRTVRDWGETCKLPKESDEKWIRWTGDSIGAKELRAPRSGWGLCSSKY